MVITRTPLRVSLVGGGTDLPDFAEAHGGAVVTTAIASYIYVIVSERFEDSLRVSYSQTEIVDSRDELQHELVREALKIAGLRRRLEVVTISDVPTQGTGLGSSSAVTVGVLNALFAYQGILKSPRELAELASTIEIEVLGKPIGRQDQFACAFGGLQLLEFGPEGSVRRTPLPLRAERRTRLERNLLMFYTGRSRSADSILEGVRDSLQDPGESTEALQKMRDLATRLAAELASSDESVDIGRYLAENWELKRSLNSQISDSQIDADYQAGIGAGASGGKLLGAGGGGFLLFHVDADRQPAVRRQFSHLRELPMRIDQTGSSVILVS
jgi:D-glycero-alpha-D-manno-heptose-7-phosphate kinase